MKPVCVPCNRFMRLQKSGYLFTEMMPKPGETRAKAGNVEPDRWTPYKVWSGDLWCCPDCKATTIVGVGREAISEHYMDDFSKWFDRCKDNVKVNDC